MSRRNPPFAARPEGPEAREAVALLRALVEAPSVNPPGDTRAPAAVARAWMRAAGLPCETVAADPTKPNLLVRVENGPGPHAILLAHLDTVPPGEEAAWSAPPLSLTERGDALIGLGSGNMKAAVAAMMLAMRRLDARRAADWSGTITLALVADECAFGPDGAAHLLATRPELRGDAVICGEGPGHMALAVAEKGLMWVRLTARGRAGQGMLMTRGAAAPVRLAAALATLDALNDERVAPPLPALDHPANAEGMRLSLNVGRLEGGGLVSQAAFEAVAEIDLRLPPGLSLADAAMRLDAACADAPLEWSRIKGWEANWTAPDAAVARAVAEAAARVRGRTPPLVTRLPASDASRWRALGVPAVCYGPQAELASGVDDAVARADLLDCVAVYAQAAASLCPP